MGQGSKFDSVIGTRGGRSNFITADDIASGDSLAKEILDEMKKEEIKFTKNKILFAAKLENGNKIFLEEGALNHIINAHGNDFKRSFGVNNSEISKLLSDTISKGKLISSKYHESNGIAGYRSKYYYQGKYMIVYGIAENGYIETAYPRKYSGGNKWWKKSLFKSV